MEPGSPLLTIERAGGAPNPVVVVHGELDVSTSPMLREELSAVLDEHPDSLTLDFGDVSFVDSSGLGSLIGALRRLRETDDGRSLRILHTQPAVARVFEITGLAQVFDLSD